MAIFGKKNKEILFHLDQLRDIYDIGAWFGKGVKYIFNEVDERIVFEKPAGQHSIVELIWHMITWKECVLDRLKGGSTDLKYFEDRDWQVLDHSDSTLWKKGLERFWQLQRELTEELQKQSDKKFDENVPGRNYNFRKLINGIRDHDIYHLGQIAYINKMLKNKF
jgi:uncharacterized damage-inducible protein DinB